MVREKWGANFDSLVKEKVVAVPGDITCENLGVKDSNFREEMCKDIDVIVNSAATTDFYDRYIFTNLIIFFIYKLINIHIYLNGSMTL